MAKKLWIFPLIFLFLIQSVISINLDTFDTKIIIYDDGVADITYLIKFDSTDFNDFIYLPAYNPNSIIATDDKQEIKYAIIGGMITVKPNANTENYLMKIRYFTNALTTKYDNNWNVYYEIPPYSSMNFNTAKESAITMILPETSTIMKSNGDNNIFLKDGSLNIKWGIKPSNISPFRVELSYTTNPNHSKIKGYIVNGLIIILASALLIIIFLKVSDTYLKKISKGKKDIIKTLTPKEKEIINLLINNKGKLTQSSIQKTTGISKATVSRTIKLMERRNIIEIRPAGNTNYILFTEWFNKK